MIREIINFVNDLERDYKEVFDLNKAPSPGLHLWVELDEEGNWKNNPPVEGTDYVVYDGKEALSDKHRKIIIQYEELGKRVGNTMNKVLDKKKQIFSCSPFVVNFKLKSYSNDKLEGIKDDKISRLLKFYFDNAIAVCIAKNSEKLKEQAIAFKKTIPEVLKVINNITVTISEKDGTFVEKTLIETFKDDFYINIYLKNVSLEEYQICHERYLREKLFNINDYNSDNDINETTWGISDFINGTGAKFTKKPFLQHKTGALYKGVASRIQAKDTIALNKFDLLLNNSVLPNPLPIFVDKNEFKNNSEIVRIFNNEGERRFSYPQLLKSIYEEDEQRVLGNYYLLNISRGVVNDFDFVSNFQYKLDGFAIENYFQLKQKGELLPTQKIRTIFGFENSIVTKIFNNGLVREKQGQFTYNYFNDIDPNYISGGDDIANLILRFRKAFYDYIYKSRKQAITSIMFDEIMLTTIISDLKHDEFKDGYHTKETSIKEKLNIWFSLYNKFSNQSKNREDMANTFKTLLEKTELVANDDNILLDDKNVAEFLFAAGQVIYFLLSKSKASNPTHAMLEPFLQKSSAPQLQNAIANAINAYKHEISFFKNRFERLASQILAFDTNENLKNYQRYLLAGYFAPSVIYKSSKKEEQSELINN
jgi:CRISPR-associated protein Csh1